MDYQTLAARITASRYSAPLSMFGGARQARLRVVISDGFSTATVTTRLVKPPRRYGCLARGNAPHVGLTRRADGGDAVRRTRRHRAGTAGPIPAQRLPVRMGMKSVFVCPRLIGVVGENVVEPAHPSAQTAFRRLEHMFVRLRARSDERPESLQVCLHHPRDPDAVGDCSFVRTRSTVALVNSDVAAWPPRSRVLIPCATASRAAS